MNSIFSPDSISSSHMSNILRQTSGDDPSQVYDLLHQNIKVPMRRRSSLEENVEGSRALGIREISNTTDDSERSLQLMMDTHEFQAQKHILEDFLWQSNRIEVDKTSTTSSIAKRFSTKTSFQKDMYSRHPVDHEQSDTKYDTDAKKKMIDFIDSIFPDEIRDTSRSRHESVDTPPRNAAPRHKFPSRGIEGYNPGRHFVSCRCEYPNENFYQHAAGKSLTELSVSRNAGFPNRRLDSLVSDLDASQVMADAKVSSLENFQFDNDSSAHRSKASFTHRDDSFTGKQFNSSGKTIKSFSEYDSQFFNVLDDNKNSKAESKTENFFKRDLGESLPLETSDQEKSRLLSSQGHLDASNLREIDGEYILSKECWACQNIKYKCPGDTIDCPLWNMQCSLPSLGDTWGGGGGGSIFDTKWNDDSKGLHKGLKSQHKHFKGKKGDFREELNRGKKGNGGRRGHRLLARSFSERISKSLKRGLSPLISSKFYGAKPSSVEEAASERDIQDYQNHNSFTTHDSFIDARNHRKNVNRRRKDKDGQGFHSQGKRKCHNNCGDTIDYCRIVLLPASHPNCNQDKWNCDFIIPGMPISPGCPSSLVTAPSPSILGPSFFNNYQNIPSNTYPSSFDLKPSVAKPSLFPPSIHSNLVPGNQIPEFSIVSRPTRSPLLRAPILSSGKDLFPFLQPSMTGSKEPVNSSSNQNKPSILMPSDLLPSTFDPSWSKPTLHTPSASKPSKPRPLLPISFPSLFRPSISNPLVSEPSMSFPFMPHPLKLEPSKLNPSSPLVNIPINSEPSISSPMKSKPSVSNPSISPTSPVNSPLMTEPSLSNPSISNPLALEPSLIYPLAKMPSSQDPVFLYPDEKLGVPTESPRPSPSPSMIPSEMLVIPSNSFPTGPIGQAPQQGLETSMPSVSPSETPVIDVSEYLSGSI
jgi:hypothetical protein